MAVETDDGINKSVYEEFNTFEMAITTHGRRGDSEGNTGKRQPQIVVIQLFNSQLSSCLGDTREPKSPSPKKLQIAIVETRPSLI